MKKKITVLTTSRADYGFLCPLLNKIEKEKTLELKLIVCGSHLSDKHGKTVTEIIKDKRKIHYKYKTLLNSKTSTSQSMELAIKGFSEAIDRTRPDLIFLPADRYEILAAASVALVKKIPVAHYAGGQLTEGAWDNSIRHAVTKLSQIHFVATKLCKKRLMQMGEDPSKIIITGSLGIENIKKMNFIKKEKLEKIINFKFGKKSALVTIHPETLGKHSPKSIVINLLEALKHFKDINLLFTIPNADEGNKIIIKKIKKFVNQKANKSTFIPSLGRKFYLSSMNLVDFVVGNSSSGIIETPSFKIPTINIGDRQKGRIKSQSIIDCKSLKGEIIKSIRKCYNIKFLKKLEKIKNPYGEGNSSEKIIKVIKNITLDNILTKKFYDF